MNLVLAGKGESRESLLEGESPSGSGARKSSKAASTKTVKKVKPVSKVSGKGGKRGDDEDEGVSLTMMKDLDLDDL